jgi:hypothetical protein
MMTHISIQNLPQNLIAVLFRFPFAVGLSLLLTGLLLNKWSIPSDWPIERICLVLTLGFFFSISATLMSEGRKWNRWVCNALSVLAFSPIGWYAYGLSSSNPVVLLLIGFFVLGIVAPFLRTNVNKDAIWSFNYRLWSHLLFSALTCLVLEVGLGTLIFSIEYLFEIKFFSDIYYDLVAVLGCFILPVMAMVGIPAEFDDLPQANTGKRIQALLDYVATPLVLIFGVVVTCYAIQIAFAQELPKGKVSILVSFLGLAGFATYMLGDHGAPDSSAQRLFRKYFFLMMVIPLVLMGFAVGNRVYDYGVTDRRYLVALALIWMTLGVLHSVIRSRKTLTRFLLLSGATLLLLASFGPWGMIEMSERSQHNRAQVQSAESS